MILYISTKTILILFLYINNFYLKIKVQSLSIHGEKTGRLRSMTLGWDGVSEAGP